MGKEMSVFPPYFPMLFSSVLMWTKKMIYTCLGELSTLREREEWRIFEEESLQMIKTGSYNNVKFVNVSLSSIMRNIRERKPIVSSTILLFVPRIDGE
jgi:hypothetical protein